MWRSSTWLKAKRIRRCSPRRSLRRSLIGVDGRVVQDRHKRQRGAAAERGAGGDGDGDAERGIHPEVCSAAPAK